MNQASKISRLILLLLLSTPVTWGQDIPGLEFNINFTIPQERANLSKLYVVEGEGIQATEKLLFDSMKSQGLESHLFYMDTGTKHKTLRKVFVEDDVSVEEILGEAVYVIMIGDAGENRLAGKLSEIGETDSRDKNRIYNITRGAVPNSTGFMIIQHDSMRVLERKSALSSPLAKYIDAAYVPIAATGLGVLLTILFNVLKTALEFKALDVGRRKRRLYREDRKILGINPLEVLALIGASCSLGLGVTYTFAGPDFTRDFLLMNIGVCMFAALSHEVAHRVIGKQFGIKIEYHFWAGGSFITLLTGYLGNTFGIQGFLMEEVVGEVAQWKQALAKLAGPLFSTFLMISIAYIHYLNPRELTQVMYTTSSLWAMAEILPFKPLDGYEVKQYNSILWKIMFIFITASFSVVNFLA